MTFKLNRAGDLCHAAVLEIRLPKLAADASGAYVWAAGYKAVQSAKLVIGGQEIERFSAGSKCSRRSPRLRASSLSEP